MYRTYPYKVASLIQLVTKTSQCQVLQQQTELSPKDTPRQVSDHTGEAFSGRWLREEIGSQFTV